MVFIFIVFLSYFQRGWVCEHARNTPITQAVFFIGSLVGGVFFGWMADYYGRVPALVGKNLYYSNFKLFKSSKEIVENGMWGTENLHIRFTLSVLLIYVRCGNLINLLIKGSITKTYSMI